MSRPSRPANLPPMRKAALIHKRGTCPCMRPSPKIPRASWRGAEEPKRRRPNMTMTR